ncbi:SDR family oxidoreductase [Fodinicurvata sp. EGI_FJ10296]|uniref:SDR family NAD(P)-dependent oxidoreductase n=1 Tax=Fodinicurvata sp. EGI_FJ10296 TaxID=3231908 RepID=UPI0034557D3F
MDRDVNRGRTALVTGASGGIGREIAAELAARGTDLILTARSAERLEQAATALHARHGITVETIAVDLSTVGGPESGADRLFSEVEARGLTIDFLINNAGFGYFGPHAESPLERDQEMIDLNISALTRLTKQVLPGMLARGHGRIMNVASVASFVPGPRMAVYHATKAYVLSYSEALAEELRGTAITVTALCPGPTQSGFAEAAEAGESPLFKGKLPTSRDVAAFGVRAMERGRRVAIHGASNKALVQSLRTLPRSVVTRIVDRISGNR